MFEGPRNPSSRAPRSAVRAKGGAEVLMDDLRSNGD